MGRRHHEGPPARRPKRSAAARGRCRSTATAGKSDASLSRAGPDTAPAGRRGGPGRASSAGSADQPRGGSRVARAGHRRASSSGRRDRSAGTGQTAVDRPPGRRSPSGASPPVLAGTPRGAGHPRRSVRVMENLGIELNRVLRGLARGSGGVVPSGPSPSRRPGGTPSTLSRPAEAIGFLPPLPSAVQTSALSSGQRHLPRGTDRRQASRTRFWRRTGTAAPAAPRRRCSDCSVGRHGRAGRSPP